jgi:hypothetical protein
MENKTMETDSTQTRKTKKRYTYQYFHSYDYFCCIKFTIKINQIESRKKHKILDNLNANFFSVSCRGYQISSNTSSKVVLVQIEVRKRQLMLLWTFR